MFALGMMVAGHFLCPNCSPEDKKARTEHRGVKKALGRLLVPQVLESIEYDLENTVFSYIPNTAETAFLGMVEGLQDFLVQQRKQAILEGKVSSSELDKILSFRPRVEKLVIKDAKLRTFITDDAHRDDLVAHVYDTTYEVIRKGVDTLVLIDDSIVRGTTLEKSILRMLDRLAPKKIIIVSSAPQIRFPDCYGIDMSRMKEFVAFRLCWLYLKSVKLKTYWTMYYQKPNMLSSQAEKKRRISLKPYMLLSPMSRFLKR
jgi:amidophosphoribosyltransferase